MAFHLTEHRDPRTFQNVVLNRLVAAEAENCVQLGLTGAMTRDGYVPVSIDHLNDPLLWTILDGRKIDLVAMQTLKKSMLVTRGSAPAAEFLAECLAQRQWVGEELVGICPSIEVAAARYSALTGRSRHLTLLLRVFELRQVRKLTPAAGCAHLCEPADRDELARFLNGLQGEIGQRPSDDVHAEAAGLIARQQAFFWIDRRPLAMASWAGRTPNGVRIAAVYTPPEFRCRGYATSLVAALSQHLLDTGRKFCFLFADKTNPVSNSIYQKIGYEPVSDRQQWSFSS